MQLELADWYARWKCPKNVYAKNGLLNSLYGHDYDNEKIIKRLLELRAIFYV